MTHTVVILSGGLDSTVALWAAIEASERVTAVTVDYGQRHHREIGAAQAIVAHYQANSSTRQARGDRTIPIEHVIVAAPSIGRSLPGSALTDQRVNVPEGHYAAPSMQSTIVPNRNMIIASIAAGIAVANSADSIVLGVHAGDHPIYPDCRPEFITALRRCIRVATGTNLDVLAPFLNSAKQTIVETGAALGAPMHLTWSCYQGGFTHCGRCGTCVERHEAFALAGISDPTEYEQ